MQLVKDLFDSKTAYYFGSEGKPRSPVFLSVGQARDWLVQKRDADYQGTDRRRAKVDRRRDRATATQLTLGFGMERKQPMGRRASDAIEVSVDVDLHAVKVQRLFSVVPKPESHPTSP